MVSRIRTSLTRVMASALALSFLLTPVTGPRSVTAQTFVTDTAVHAPPSSGTYAYYATYGTFGPDQSGFPGQGQSYIDPVFGSTIRRLTNELNQQSESEIYSKNGYFNADGTRVHHRAPSGHTIIDTRTGQVVVGNPAFNAESSFAPDDPDTWYSWAMGDTTMYKNSISTGAHTAFKTFPGALGQLGGSVDWIDRTGRYMVVHVGGTFTIYDKQSDILYSGGVPDNFMGGPVSQGGWVGISPDASYVISSTPPIYSHSWKVDHTNHAVSTSPVLFWSLCGGHGDVMSASNGKTYYVTFDCNTTGSIYRADVSLPQTTSNVSQQLSQNMKLVQLTSWADVDGHFSRVSKGAFSDWVFASVETGSDGFTGSLSGWRAYEQEILMMNVLTGEVRRVAHHRSRGISGSYYYQPRVNSAWDASVVGFTSNFGYSSSGYADLYVLVNPGGSSGTTTSALAVSFSSPASGATVSGTTTVGLAASGGSGSGYTYGLTIDGTAVSMSGSSYSWNTTTAANGTHTLTATVTDSGGASATASLSVTVQNTTTTSSPTVSFTNPSNGATVSGMVTVSVGASGGTGSGYSYVVKAGTTTIYNGSNNAFSWNTTTTANGSMALSATVTDSAGKTGTASESVTVSNTTSTTSSTDTTPPTVKITSPASGVWTGNSIQVFASATDNVKLARIDLWGAGKKFASFSCSTASCSGNIWWVTGSLPAGAYLVNAVAVDAAGNQAVSATIKIYKDATSPTYASGAPTATNVTPPPSSPLTTSFTSPASGATVSGTVTVGMSDSGASGSSTFTLSVDGTRVSSQTVTGSTATYSWNTTGVTNGSHTLGLSVTDGGGGTATASIGVTVSNTTIISTSTDTTPPTVQITSPASGVWTGNSIQIFASATDNLALNRIELWGAGTKFATFACSGTTCSGNIWWVTGSLPAAGYVVNAVAVDAAGNRTVSAPITIYKDATSPINPSGA